MGGGAGVANNYTRRPLVLRGCGEYKGGDLTYREHLRAQCRMLRRGRCGRPCRLGLGISLRVGGRDDLL